MLDLQFVCDNLDAVRANCQHRHVAADLDRLLELRELRSQLITAIDKDRQRQNE
ncbi:MAG: serine--tRNA ligase, partial [Schlesneria sp.]